MIKKFNVNLAKLAAKEEIVFASHSIDEATDAHHEKLLDKRNRKSQTRKKIQS